MQIYKANKSNRGCALSLSFNSKEGALFTQLISQVSYDENRHIGSFSGGNKVTIKSSVAEVGNFIDVFTRNVEYSTVHRGQNGDMTQIWLSPYLVGEGDAKIQKGFGLRVSKKTKDGQELKLLMPLNFGEAAALKVYFDFFLRHVFSAEYAEAKKQYKDRQDSKPKSKEIAPTQDDLDEIS